MPPYITRIGGKQIKVDCPGLLGGSEFGRIRKRIAAELDRGETNGRFKFRSKLPEVGTVPVKWGFAKVRKPKGKRG